MLWASLTLLDRPAGPDTAFRARVAVAARRWHLRYNDRALERSCYQSERRFRTRRHAFYIAAFPGPSAIGRDFRPWSGPRIEVPGSWVIPQDAWACSSFRAPTPRGDGTDDRLTASMDVDVLDSDLLLPLAA